MARKHTKVSMVSRKCERYNYNAVDDIHYVPSIEFVVSDGLVRIASKERGDNPDYKPTKVMLCFTIAEAQAFAAEINRQCVIAAQQ